MAGPEEDTTLKLHTGPAGEIWYAAGQRAPVNSSKRFDEFLEIDIRARAPEIVRVLGLSVNAKLISQLYVQSRRYAVGRVELAGPRVCETTAERRDPEITLFRMRQCLLPAAYGGWHVMSPRDYPCYALAARLQDHDDQLDELARRILHTHPAWQPLQFLRGLDPTACARVFAHILDPRWYIAPRRPERLSALRIYLGLTQPIQTAISSQRVSPRLSAHAQRCRDVLAAWRTAEPPTSAELQIPDNFLWRIWAAAGKGVRGDLRASQAFVTFLRHVWLDAMEGRAGPRDGLFDLTSVFKTPGEIQAYRAHIAKVVSPV